MVSRITHREQGVQKDKLGSNFERIQHNFTFFCSSQQTAQERGRSLLTLPKTKTEIN